MYKIKSQCSPFGCTGFWTTCTMKCILRDYYSIPICVSHSHLIPHRRKRPPVNRDDGQYWLWHDNGRSLLLPARPSSLERYREILYIYRIAAAGRTYYMGNQLLLYCIPVCGIQIIQGDRNHILDCRIEICVRQLLSMTYTLCKTPDQQYITCDMLYSGMFWIGQRPCLLPIHI